jgi:hypothetical protein
MLQLDETAHLLALSGQAARRLLEGKDDGVVPACRLLLRTMHEIGMYFDSGHDMDMTALADEMEAFLDGADAAGQGQTVSARTSDELAGGGYCKTYSADGAALEGELEAEGGFATATGGNVAHIKEHLRVIVQVMPQWNERQHDIQLIESLITSFRAISESAQELNLTELAQMALMLERLLAKINDEMMPMTVQMMYGVVEQGVLKLGVLFLQFCQPHDSTHLEGVRAKLASAVGDMRLLANEVDSTVVGAVEACGENRVIDLDNASVAHRHGTEGNHAAAAGPHRFESVEDLMIEANLLHQHLLPRIERMKQQQRHLESQLVSLKEQVGSSAEGPEPFAPLHDGASRIRVDRASLLRSRGDEFVDPGRLSEHVNTLLGANRSLAELIDECEQCLTRYRRAGYEMQQAMLGACPSNHVATAAVSFRPKFPIVLVT